MAKKQSKKKASPRKKAKARARAAPKKKAKTSRKKLRTWSEHGPRPDYGTPTDAYFDAIDDAQVRDAAVELRDLVRGAAPKATECIKWGIPVWEHRGMLCAVTVHKAYARIQFFDAGTSLDDPKQLLEGTGKACRHVKVRPPVRTPKTALKSLIRQAVRFNNEAERCDDRSRR